MENIHTFNMDIGGEFISHWFSESKQCVMKSNRFPSLSIKLQTAVRTPSFIATSFCLFFVSKQLPDEL